MYESPRADSLLEKGPAQVGMYAWFHTKSNVYTNNQAIGWVLVVGAVNIAAAANGVTVVQAVAVVV